MSSFELLVRTSNCIGFALKVKPNFDIFKFNIIGDPDNFSMVMHCYVELEEGKVKEK